MKNQNLFIDLSVQEVEAVVGGASPFSAIVGGAVGSFVYFGLIAISIWLGKRNPKVTK